MIYLSDIAKSYAGKTLFDKADLTVHENSKIGLVGSNGSGKTTFLKIISGEVEPDKGRVSVKKGLKIGFLDQEISIAVEERVIESVVESARDIRKLFQEKEEVESFLKGSNLDLRFLGT